MKLLWLRRFYRRLFGLPALCRALGHRLEPAGGGRGWCRDCGVICVVQPGGRARPVPMGQECPSPGCVLRWPHPHKDHSDGATLRDWPVWACGTDRLLIRGGYTPCGHGDQLHGPDGCRGVVQWGDRCGCRCYRPAPVCAVCRRAAYGGHCAQHPGGRVIYLVVGSSRPMVVWAGEMSTLSNDQRYALALEMSHGDEIPF